MFTGRVRATINLRALQHNFVLAKLEAQAANPGVKMLAVVKANAYGNGLAPVAQALENDADAFGVTDVNEAMLLRELAPRQSIVILQGLIDEDDLELVSCHGFHLVISTPEQVQLIIDSFAVTPPEQPLHLWLKLDSGMGRLGLSPDEYVAAWQQLAAQPWVAEMVMMTHFANSAMPEHPLTRQQLAVFRSLEAQLGQVNTSITASAGLFLMEPVSNTWSRPGIMLYGSSPFHWREQDLRAASLGIHTVHTLEAKLIAVKDMKAGDNIGYCSRYICERDMTVGIVSIGYADGYPVSAPNGTPVLVNGERTGTVGRVSMDMLAVDLSPMPDAQPGDPVTLWGEGLPIDEVAAATDIISYSLMSNLTARVRFRYLD